MKLLLLSTLLFSSTTFANTFHCDQRNVSKSAPKFSAVIREVKDITNEVSYGKAFDKVFKVEVTLTKTTNKKKETKTFEAVATTEDVMYNVHALKTQGVSIHIFLDEQDEASMTLIENGVKTSIPFSCQ